MTRDFVCSTYFDRSFNRQAVKILPGEYYATAADTMIVTVLGSCVSVCLRDRLAGIGGMNHFMLPGHGAQSPSARYGVKAMEVLLEHLKHLGADHSRLEAKVFGAGRVVQGMGDVGSHNADFALEYLGSRGIPVSALDVGDVHPRKVYFSPRTGRVLVRRIRGCADDSAAR